VIEAWEYSQQIFFDGNAESTARFHDRQNGGDLGPGVDAADVQPVLPVMCD
jgi:hypothetical protein